jgi:CheY-like chemotaxis protein
MNSNPVVLYVEDDPASREVMELILRELMGCDAYHIFEDSEDFLPRVNALMPRPDVILLDIHVPPFSGFEMLDMLRAISAYRHIPIVALTASVMNEEVQRLQQSGFNAVFSKPVDIDSFPDSLARILQGETFWQIVE